MSRHWFPARLAIYAAVCIVVASVLASAVSLVWQTDDPPTEQMTKSRDFAESPNFRSVFDTGVPRRTAARSHFRNANFAQPIDTQRTISVGFIPTAISIGTLQERVPSDWKLLAIVAILLSAFNLGLLFYVVRRLRKQKSKLLEFTRALSDGDFDFSLDKQSGFDADTLRGLNQMRRSLRARIEELWQQRQQLATVLEAMSEAVIATDDQGRILLANPSAGELFGFDIATSQGKALIECVRIPALNDSVTHTLSTGQPAQVDAEIGGSDSRTLAIHATPLPGTPTPGIVLVINDITELRRLEGLRQEFIANVSHELKTPLSSIKAYAETLLNGALSDTENNSLFVKRIAEQTDRLQQLIMDMLSLARIESAQQSYEIVPVPVADVVQTSLLAHETNASAKNITLSTAPPEVPVNVRAEAEALRQILDNLIKNAIMYTGSGGSVTVAWAADDQTVTIDVRDTGIGIAPEHQARLFERFFRVDKARSRELGGTGLGLSIVKHLTQFFGGTVSVQSQVGRGTVFSVRLPRA